MPDTVELKLRYTLDDGTQPQVVREWVRTIQATELIGGSQIMVPTTGYTLPIDVNDTIDTLFIVNRDVQNAVQLEWQRRYTGSPVTLGVGNVTFTNGPPQQIQTAATITLFESGDIVEIVAANNPTNIGKRFVEELSDSDTDIDIPLGSTAFVAETDPGTVTAHRWRQGRARIEAGGWFHLDGTVNTGEIYTDLVLKGASSTVPVEVWVFKT